MTPNAISGDSVSKKDDGGPAFPSLYDAHPDRHGLTLRDYFIAHAPAEPQPWFEPVMHSERPRPIFADNDDPSMVYPSWAEAERAVGDDGFHDANYDAGQDWDREKSKQRYIQWPAAWADEMLKQRSKP